MYLIESWRESFLFLKPQSLKLLLLATLRIFRDSYKFFIFLFFLFVLFEGQLWGLFFDVNITAFDVIQKILLVDLFFIFILVARPSVKRKTKEYFCDYSLHFVYWLFIPLIIVPVLEFIFKIVYLPELLAATIFPIEVFLILFWLDSRLSIKNLFLSLLRSAKMFLFNFPFCLIAFIFPYLILFQFLNKYVELLFFIFYICFFTVLYTKRIHDQFNLYFAE